MNITRLRTIAIVTTAAMTMTAVTACGRSDRSAATDTGVISYWLWDSAQQPGYQKCADAFASANPGLRVQITQYGWDDYWSKVTSGFVADTAPDVFTDHVSKFAQYVDLGVLRPLDDLDATKDLKDSDYQSGLAQLWKGPDGKRYGAPKDWDTVAVFVNRDKTGAAGITDAQLNTMTWNPQDGGTFEKIVSHLTVDVNGVRGDEPGFDKTRVKTHGIAFDHGGGDGFGQTQWSAFTGSTGFTYTDKNPWGSHFNFDSPEFQKTINWYFGLARKGYAPSFEKTAGDLGFDRQIGSGSAAMAIHGSWMISTFDALTDAQGKKMNIGIVPTPIGPTGKRASMFNGLADSVTSTSRQPQNAAKWVKFLSGEQCQNIIGNAGVVFPARRSGTEAAVEFNRRERHLDVTPFTRQVSDKTTFLFPVTYLADDIKAILGPALDSIYIGQEPVSEMTTYNEQINALLTHRPGAGS